MIWKDRLPKAPLDPQRVLRETGPLDVLAWTQLLNGFQAELPEPFAIIDVLEGPGCEEACEALRALRRNPRSIPTANTEMTSNRMWNVNPVLHDIVEIKTPGTALDLGCGAGRDSVWLAANGWEVTAIDRLEGNIDILRKLRLAYAPDDPIHWQVANLNDLRPQGEYDLVLLHYCWDSNYIELAQNCVAENGFLSILAHTQKHYSCYGYPRESKLFDANKLPKKGFQTISHKEFWSIDRHSISVVWQRR
jgi:SAM-dependent methyltransferase